MDVNSSFQKCGLCGESVGRPFLQGLRDLQYGGIERVADISACNACGLLQQSPMPTREEALGFYPENYTHYNFRPSRLRTALQRVYFRPLVKLLRSLGAKPGDRVLDIGSATGDKAAFLRDHLGFSVTGLEPNARAAARAREVFGVETIADFFPSPKLANERFDFIYFNHVIEHVPEPVQLLNDIHHALKPGGWLIGETENISAPSAKLFGRYWSLYHMPFHLYFFTPESLADVFRASRFEGMQHYCTWDPSCIPISIRNYLRRNKRPDEVKGTPIPGLVLWMLLSAPIAILEKSRGPVIRFWAQRQS